MVAKARASSKAPKVTKGRVTARPSFYDDPGFNYAQWWLGRGYEHEAEVIAIRRLLHGRRFGHAVDVGGGYGRLSVVLAEYAARVTLVDSSQQQLDIARDFLARHRSIDRRWMTATELDFPDASADLVAMIRVLHHLPDPAAEFAEASRILRPGGYAIVEAANSAHAVNRVRYLLRRRQVPAAAVDIRSDEFRNDDNIVYVNHHPETVARQLTSAGLVIRRRLSVSNLRHPLAKKVLPERVMLSVEQAAQRPLARICFGPSMFFLAQK